MAFNNEPESISEGVKSPEMQIVKLYIKHDNRPNIKQNGEHITINNLQNNNNHWATGSWLGTGT